MSAINELAQQLQAEVRQVEDDATSVAQGRRNRLLHWFQDLPLAAKVRTIFATFGAIAFALLAMLGFGLALVYEQDRTHDEVREALKASASLRASAGEFRYNAVRYIFAGEESTLERQQQSRAKAAEQLVRIRQLVDEHLPRQVGGVNAIADQLDAYDSKFDEMRNSLAENGRDERSSAIAFELSALGDALYTRSYALENELGTAADAIKQSNYDLFTNLLTIFAVAAIAALAVLNWGMRYFTHDFARKVTEITGGMSRLAKGDREFEISGIERKDEIGKMLRSLAYFKQGLAKLEEWAAERAERATAELEQQERVREEQVRVLNQVANDFERTVGDVVGSVAAASSQLKSTAGNMASAAEDTTRQTGEAMRSMTEANAGANAAAAASDEFAMSIGEISRQAASSAELAREANSAACEADTTISNLSESATEIGQIVDMIQSIAKRTNLLALNASIEAARGGEAGRGFAVVASEVKELAAQTSQATEKVAGKIAAIQDSTGASVDALRRISSQVSELETTATSIAAAVDQQAIAGQDLARSIDMAARATNNVTGNIEDVRELSLSTGAAASQVLASSTELENQADTLRGQVNAFLAKVRSS